MLIAYAMNSFHEMIASTHRRIAVRLVMTSRSTAHTSATASTAVTANAAAHIASSFLSVGLPSAIAFTANHGIDSHDPHIISASSGPAGLTTKLRHGVST